MAQRKTPPPGSKTPSKATSKNYVSTTKKPAASGRPAGTSTGARPQGVRTPPKKPGKSIVNQKQTPWGLIWTTVAVVVFAAVVVAAVIWTRSDKSTKTEGGASVGNCTEMIGSNPTSYLNELKCASQIKGITFKPEPNRSHVTTTVKYDTTPPIGGNHNPVWADCDGTVYPNAIANENAVHMLEHGAVWITYNRDTISSGDLATLKKLVDGQPRMAMSPYPNLDSPISLQSWGYQLKVDKASDPRVKQFIDDLRYNPKTTPEYGAVCSDPEFKNNPSTFGHPTDVGASMP
jgi:hypothetical protein